MAPAPPANASVKVRLGDLLIREGLLRPDQLARGLEEQQSFGGRLGRHLVDLGFVTEAVLLDALSRQLRIPKIDLDAPGAVGLDVARYCRADIAERMGFCPVAMDPKSKVLTIAVADPEPQILLDIETMTGLRIEPRLALLEAIDRLHARLYDGSQLQVQQMRGLQVSRAAEKGPGLGSTSMDDALGPPPAARPQPAAPPPAPPPPPVAPAFDQQLQAQLQAQLQQQQQQFMQMQIQMQNAAGQMASMAPQGMQTMGYPPQGYAGGYPNNQQQARPAPAAQAPTPPPAPSPRYGRDRDADAPPPTYSSRVAPMLPTPEEPQAPAAGDLSDELRRLEKTLANQARALRSLVEVLVDKGLITKSEMARKQK